MVVDVGGERDETSGSGKAKSELKRKLFLIRLTLILSDNGNKLAYFKYLKQKLQIEAAGVL